MFSFAIKENAIIFPKEIISGNWNFSYFKNNRYIEESPISISPSITFISSNNNDIQFGYNYMFSGYTGINYFKGNYQLFGNKIRMIIKSTTLLDSIDKNLIYFEEKYTKMINQVYLFKIESTNLELISKNGILVYSREI